MISDSNVKIVVLGSMKMGSITILRIEDEVKSKLRIRAEANGNSMEEEARQIICRAVNRESVEVIQASKEMSTAEIRLLELEKSGELVKAKSHKRDFSPGKRVSGALERFLAER